MTSHLRDITSDLDYYKVAYDVFERRANKTELLQNWATNNFHEIVINRFRPTVSEDEFVSLGIGSGSGIFESVILRQILKCRPQISHSVIEPSRPYIHQYQSLISDPDSGLHGVTFHWLAQTWQMYKEEVVPKGRQFNFISAVNSLYYVDNLREDVGQLLNLLTEDGLLFIALRTDTSTGFKLHNSTDLTQHLPQRQESIISSSDVKSILHDLKIPFRSSVLPVTVDITDVFDPDDDEGNMLLDQITNVLHFRRSVPPAACDAVLRFLMNDHASRSADDADGSITFKIDFEMIIVRGKENFS